MLLLFIFGAGSAASPDYTWMVILRGFTGFFLGGIAQGVTICCEYYPANTRGTAGFYLTYYWAIGTLGVIGIAWILIGKYDTWRFFVFTASLPALVVFMTMPWFPESARFYLVNNQKEKAYKQLEQLAHLNKIQMPRGTLMVPKDSKDEMGKLLDLLHPNMRRASLLLLYIWLSTAMSYYGVCLVTPYIITHGSLIAKHENSTRSDFTEEFQAVMPCKKYTDKNYFDLLWSSAAEFPGLLIFSIVIESCSRKVLLSTACIICSFLLLFLMLEIKPTIALFIVLFVVRGLSCAIFQMIFIMTTEIFPTTLRATAMGVGSGSARLGGVIIPFLSQVLVISHPVASIFGMAGICFLAGVAAMLLPVETRGRYMEDIIKRDENVETDDLEQEMSMGTQVQT